MNIEIYILFQIIAIIGLFLVFFTDIPLMSALTAVLSGVLVVGAWVLTTGQQMIWDPAIRAYVTEPVIVSTPYLAIINMIIFGLALVYFFYDVYNLIQDETPNVGGGIASGRQQPSQKQ